MKLRGKVAVVTGAARGIGREIARRFAAEGASVYLFDLRGGEEAAGQMREHGLDVSAISLDITNEAAVNSAVVAIIEKKRKIDKRSILETDPFPSSL